jgi:hypothetical protein
MTDPLIPANVLAATRLLDIWVVIDNNTNAHTVCDGRAMMRRTVDSGIYPAGATAVSLAADLTRTSVVRQPTAPGTVGEQKPEPVVCKDGNHLAEYDVAREGIFQCQCGQR